MDRPEALRAAAAALKESGSRYAAKTLELAASASEIVADTSLSTDRYTEGVHAALNALWEHVRRGE